MLVLYNNNSDHNLVDYNYYYLMMISVPIVLYRQEVYVVRVK